MTGTGTTTQSSYVVDDRNGGRFLVNRRSMTDLAVLELERRTIFDRCWLYVGHESEVREPDTIRTRTVGGRPLMFLRDNDGRVQVFINSCPHRGNVLCREDEMSTRFLKCFFHAWTFDTRGALVSLVDEEAYGPEFDRSRYHLASPPQIDSYQGFVFVCFDPAAPGLRDYLAGAADYLDLLTAQSLGQGMEILGGVQRYTIRANWKLLAENSVDSYHAPTTHKRWFELLRADGLDGEGRRARGHTEVFELGNGHAVTRAPVLAGEPSSDQERAAVEAHRERLIAELGPDAAALLERTRALLIFPNLVVIDLPPGITVRTFEPTDPGAMTVTAWPMAPRGDSAELRRRRLEFYVSFWGPAGLGTPDDVEALEGLPTGICRSSRTGVVGYLPWYAPNRAPTGSG